MVNKPGNVVGRILLWFAALIVIFAAWAGAASMFEGWFNPLIWATFGQAWLAWLYVVIIAVAVIYALIILIAFPFMNKF